MRKAKFCIVFMATIFLAANPVEPMIVQQLWFDNNDKLIMQLGEQSFWFSSETICIECDGLSMQITIPDEQEGGSLPEFNLSELMPGIAATRESGSVSIDLSYATIHESVSWGDNWDCDTDALIGTQSIYQYLDSIHTPDGRISMPAWAKSPDPSLVSYYNCSSHSQVSIYVKNLEGIPIENIPVYYQDHIFAYGYTDGSGLFVRDINSRNSRFRVFAPDVQDVPALEAIFMAQPDEVYNYTVTIDYTSNTDPTLPAVIGKFSLKPNVINSQEAMVPEFDKKLERPAVMKLYDIKGRYIQSYAFVPQQSWIPPSLSSGMYFLRLMDGKNTLGTAKFIILK